MNSRYKDELLKLMSLLLELGYDFTVEDVMITILSEAWELRVWAAGGKFECEEYYLDSTKEDYHFSMDFDKFLEMFKEYSTNLNVSGAVDVPFTEKMMIKHTMSVSELITSIREMVRTGGKATFEFDNGSVKITNNDEERVYKITSGV